MKGSDIMSFKFIKELPTPDEIKKQYRVVSYTFFGDFSNLCNLLYRSHFIISVHNRNKYGVLSYCFFKNIESDTSPFVYIKISHFKSLFFQIGTAI